MFLGQLFVKNAKKWPWNTFWTSEIGRHLKIEKIQKSQGTTWKRRFSIFKKPEQGHYQDIYLKFLHVYTEQVFFRTYSMFFFRKFENLHWNIGENVYYASKLSEVSKFCKSEMAVWRKRSFSIFCWKSVGSVFYDVCVTTFPANHNFCLKPGNMTSLWPTYQN